MLRVESTLQNLFDMGFAPLFGLVVLLLVVLPLCLVIFRLPFLYSAILAVGLATGLSFGLGFVGQLGRFVLVAFLAIVALVDRKPFHMTRGTWIFLICVVLYILQFPRAASLFDAVTRMLYYICAFFGYVILTQKLCQNPDQFRKAIYWMVAVSFLMVWAQVFFLGQAGGGRLMGIFVSVTYCGYGLSMAILLILYALIAGYLKRLFMIVGIVTLTLAVVMLMLTGVRAMVLAGILSLPFLLKMRPGRGFVVVLVGAVLLVLILPFMLISFQEYGSGIQRLTSMDSSGRFVRWSMMWEEIKESPIIGYGMMQDMQTKRHAHNSFLQAAYSSGVPTAMLILLGFTAAVMNSWWQIGKLPVGPQRQMAALSGALLMLVYINSYMNAVLLSMDLYFTLFCIGLGIQNAISHYIAEGRRAHPGIYYASPAGANLAYGTNSLTGAR